jgi:hypothetical protein
MVEVVLRHCQLLAYAEVRENEPPNMVCGLFVEGSQVGSWVDDVNGSGKCLRWSEVWGVEGRWPPEARAGGWFSEVGCNTAFCFTSF